jgi:hypothetical protein
LLVGIAALTRTTILGVVPILLFWLQRYKGLRLISLPCLAFIAVAALAYSPWPVRNSLALGSFMPGSSESMEWLWRGTNPNATGSSYTTDGRTMLQAAPEDFQIRVGQANESGRIVVYRDAALQYIHEHPFDAARLYVTKVKSFWLGSETTGLLYPPAWTILYESWYGAMLVLAALGVFFAWRTDRRLPLLILASLLLVCLSQAVFYVEGRHRLAVEPLLLVLSGGGLARLARLPAMQLTGLGRAKSSLP